MQDAYDPPAPSIAKPMLYGAALGLASMAIFTVAYLVAPDFTLPGTFLIAGAIAVAAAAALNAVPSRASGEMAALARGEDLAPFPMEVAALTPAPPPPDAEIAEHEARVAELRRATDTIDRTARPVEWLDALHALADELRMLATAELVTTNRRHRRSGLSHLRQAAGFYQRIVGAKGLARSGRQWGTAEIALGECLLVLGEAEGARHTVMEAVRAFTTGLEVADLAADERRAGEDGLGRAEGVLASMAETSRRPDDDVDFL